MKKSNKQKIETLLLYCSHSEVAGMLNQPLLTFVTKLSDWSFTPDDEKIISNIQPLKQIVLILSGQFMKEHPRAGEPTYFKEKIQLAVFDWEQPTIMSDSAAIMPKLHTIRADYDGWIEKIAAVNRGEAFLRVVTWAGEAYRSPWVDVAVLTKDDGIGVQPLIFPEHFMLPVVCGESYPNPTWYKDIQCVELGKNDGLEFADFKAWFKGYDLSKPMAIIHFTKFRY